MKKSYLVAGLLASTLLFTGCSNSISSVDTSTPESISQPYQSYTFDVGIVLDAKYVDENTISIEMQYTKLEEMETKKAGDSTIELPSTRKYILSSLITTKTPITLDDEFVLQLHKSSNGDFVLSFSKYVEDKLFNTTLIPKRFLVTKNSITFSGLKQSQSAHYTSIQTIRR